MARPKNFEGMTGNDTEKLTRRVHELGPAYKPMDYVPARKAEWAHLTQVSMGSETRGYLDVSDSGAVTTFHGRRDDSDPDQMRSPKETLLRVGAFDWLLQRANDQPFSPAVSEIVHDETALEWLKENGWTVIDHVNDFDYPLAEPGPVYLRGSFIESIENADVIVSENSALTDPGDAHITVIDRSEIAGEMRTQGESTPSKRKVPADFPSLNDESLHSVDVVEATSTETATIH